MRRRIQIILFSFFAMSCNSSTSSKSVPPSTDPNQIPGDGTGSLTTEEGSTEGDEKDLVVAINLDGIKSFLPGGLTIDRATYLTNLGDDLAERVKSFRMQTETLAAAAEAYCLSFSAEDMQSLQKEWMQAMAQWQHFEVFQIGPILENGKTMKSKIYTWPDRADHCKIDEEALKARNSAKPKLPPVPSRTGMTALEYLIFDSTFVSRCPADSAKGQEWNALSKDDKLNARCAYIKPLTLGIIEQGKQLENAWGTPGDNHFTRAIGDETLEQLAIQQIYDGFYYVDLQVKNLKLAAPAGLDIKHCPKSPKPCPERAEFQFADFSRQAIEINIKAMIDIFFGPSPERKGGLSSFVRAQGGDSVSARTEDNLMLLDRVNQAEPGLTFAQLIENRRTEDCRVSDKSWLCKTHSLIRALASDLKREYLQILKVKMPEGAAQDND